MGGGSILEVRKSTTEQGGRSREPHGSLGWGGLLPALEARGPGPRQGCGVLRLWGVEAVPAAG